MESCTIITTDANKVIRPIHDRMPMILGPADYDTWLDSELRDPGRLQPLLWPCPSERIAYYLVSRRVGNPINDSPECVRPLESG
jgi:putative SOS response-associated peptidase YedK